MPPRVTPTQRLTRLRVDVRVRLASELFHHIPRGDVLERFRVLRARDSRDAVAARGERPGFGG